MTTKKATAAQASYIASLAEQLDHTTVEKAFARAAKINCNATWTYDSCETITKAVRRLTVKAASSLIDDLKDKKDAQNYGYFEDYELDDDDYDDILGYC